MAIFVARYAPSRILPLGILAWGALCNQGGLHAPTPRFRFRILRFSIFRSALFNSLFRLGHPRFDIS